MKLSVNWLRELVPSLPDDVQALGDRLTLLGLEVEALQAFELSFPGVVIGHVLEVAPHPEADRLRLCRVNVGSDELEIVCGAANVRAGLHVPVATIGAVLPGDFRIKRSKIRGRESMGMICSEKELGLGQGHEGIMELEGSMPVGRAFDELFGVRDHVIEIEVTPNRPDWLSHIGVARELAAHYGGRVHWPRVSDEVRVVEADDGYSVRIHDTRGCRRFRARLVDDVRVGPSPVWLRQRLLTIGQRPINAVVDASNYVLHECGHPNHCFDRDKIRGRTIHLRRAQQGERFTTLDGVERILGAHHLLVADDERGLALAGIMGGAFSEVDETTRNLLLEVAVFDPRVIRRGRRDHGLSTDASYRFERGVDSAAVPWVSRRLADLIDQVAGGRARDVAVEATGEAPAETTTFFVRAPRVARLLGVELPVARMEEILAGLEIPAERARRDGVEGFDVTCPTFRHDLAAEVDVVEELARHHGYDALPERARVPLAVPAAREHGETFRRRLREAFAARGFHEVLGSSFMPEGDPRSLGFVPGEGPCNTLEVLNPVVHDERTLKSTAIGEMARIVERNRRRGHTGPIRLFQIARNFRARTGQDLPDETDHLLVAWSGPVRPLHADEPERRVDLYDALGDLESILAEMRIGYARVPVGEPAWLRTGTGVRMESDGSTLGVVGEMAPAVGRTLDVEDPVILAELDFASLVHARVDTPRFVAFSAYPPSRRDLSLVVPRTVGWSSLVRTVQEVAGDLLEHCDLFDVYAGPDLPADCEALGVRLSLRSLDGTLKDKRVDALVQQLLDRLAGAHGVHLRAAAPPRA